MAQYLPGDSQTWQAIAFATLLPGATMIAGVSLWTDEKLNFKQFFETSKQPKWAIKDENILSAVDSTFSLLTMYGAYRVFKAAGCNTDTGTVACASYAALHLVGTGGMLTAFYSKNHVNMYYSMCVVHLLQLSTMFTFHQVDTLAGLLVVPSLIWGHLAVQVFKGMAELN